MIVSIPVRYNLNIFSVKMIYLLSLVSIPVRYNLNKTHQTERHRLDCFNSCKVQFELTLIRVHLLTLIRFNSCKVQFELLTKMLRLKRKHGFNSCKVQFERVVSSTCTIASSSFNSCKVQFEPGDVLDDFAYPDVSIPVRYNLNSPYLCRLSCLILFQFL